MKRLATALAFATVLAFGMQAVSAQTLTTIKNRGDHERLMVLEHPIQADWKLVDALAKPGQFAQAVREAR